MAARDKGKENGWNFLRTSKQRGKTSPRLFLAWHDVFLSPFEHELEFEAKCRVAKSYSSFVALERGGVGVAERACRAASVSGPLVVYWLDQRLY